MILAGKGRARGGQLPSGAFLSHPAISSSFQKKGFLFDGARKPEQDPGEPEGSFCFQSRTEDKREEVVIKRTPPSARVQT